MTYLVVETLELDFVLERLLELGSTENVLNLSQLSVPSFDRSFHHFLVLVRDDSGGLLHHFSIVTILVSPLARVRVSKEVTILAPIIWCL